MGAVFGGGPVRAEFWFRLFRAGTRRSGQSTQVGRCRWGSGRPLAAQEARERGRHTSGGERDWYRIFFCNKRSPRKNVFALFYRTDDRRRQSGTSVAKTSQKIYRNRENGETRRVLKIVGGPSFAARRRSVPCAETSGNTKVTERRDKKQKEGRSSPRGRGSRRRG